MKYNLTPAQKDAAKWIVERIRAGEVGESFTLRYLGGTPNYSVVGSRGELGSDETNAWRRHLSIPQTDALAMVQMMRVQPLHRNVFGKEEEYARTCTVTGFIYEAVDANFADDSTSPVVSTLTRPHPVEIAMSLDRFRERFPDAKKVGFLIMRFAAAKPFERIVAAIKGVAAKHGLTIVRADEFEFHGELWGNVRTYLHGCGFGIAVYERIETDEPNANVGLEVGYLLAMGKPVLLLKDQTVPTLQADLAGRLYKAFDPHNPEGTVPAQVEKWLTDYGVIVGPH